MKKGWLYPTNGMCSWLLGCLGPTEPRCQEWPRTKREKVKSDCRRSLVSSFLPLVTCQVWKEKKEWRKKEDQFEPGVGLWLAVAASPASSYKKPDVEEFKRESRRGTRCYERRTYDPLCVAEGSIYNCACPGNPKTKSGPLGLGSMTVIGDPWNGLSLRPLLVWPWTSRECVYYETYWRSRGFAPRPASAMRFWGHIWHIKKNTHIYGPWELRGFAGGGVEATWAALQMCLRPNLAWPGRWCTQVSFGLVESLRTHGAVHCWWRCKHAGWAQEKTDRTKKVLRLLLVSARSLGINAAVSLRAALSLRNSRLHQWFVADKARL